MEASVQRFQRTVYAYYRRHRRFLPWRTTRNPYHILVSEVMLQQTQVPRVAKKYSEFIHAFPSIRSLANAPLKRIVRVWQGMGYNRRALSLKKLSREIVRLHHGSVPRTAEELVRLPGLGNATANAVLVYAYNEPVVFIETNIRAAFIHHFFPHRAAVADKDLAPFVAAALDRRNPRRWYSALMDYGAWVKKEFKNPGRKSAFYSRQPKFEGSNRQVRGAIIRALSARTLDLDAVAKEAGFGKIRIQKALSELRAEGFIRRQGARYRIA
ncbi:MAG: A/G-specific adenine glycosylase [Patescibacteria group bacterium]|nr:A/G-specific adenine glycosylase [Patescibacteria group bacterium]MDD5715387.1 A/G-specific adenine glycosylase [Patescibacteria group bacterium]